MEVLASQPSRPLADRGAGVSAPAAHARLPEPLRRSDSVQISDQGRARLETETRSLEAGPETGEAPVDEALRRAAREAEGDPTDPDGEDDARNPDGEQKAEAKTDKPEGELSSRDLDLLRDLQGRDREVRAHEQAHQAAGGQYAGHASFAYQQGPDGRRYAIGGEVPIDVGRENEPEATIRKMQVVKRAALAPAQPSAADRRIASSASIRSNQAQVELFRQHLEEANQRRAEEGEQAKQGRLGQIEDDEPDAAGNGGPSLAQIEAVRGPGFNAVA
jgi:hypothetical protein